MLTNHDLTECETCLWNLRKGYKGCEAFNDKRNVILDKEGRCNGYVSKEETRDNLRVYLDSFSYE
jgi:hypothetical protein